MKAVSDESIKCGQFFVDEVRWARAGGEYDLTEGSTVAEQQQRRLHVTKLRKRLEGVLDLVDAL